MRRIFLLGKVVGTKDEKGGIGRVQVELQGFDKPIKTPFLRLIVPYGGGKDAKHGWVFLPEEGEEVVCLAPGVGDDLSPDDLAAMVVLGSVYSGANKPAYSNKDGKNITKQLVTPAGNSIVISDKKGEEKITVQCKDEKTSMVFDAKTPKIEIKTEKVTITLTKDALTIKTDKAVTVEAGADVSVTAKGKLTMSGTKGVEIDAGSAKCVIKGMEVDLC